MFLFKCGLFSLSSSIIVSLCSQVAFKTKSLDTGLIFLCVASGAIAVKIMYNRHQQINTISSLTTDPNVASFANKISSFSACLLSLGFLVHLSLFLLKVDNYSVTAFNIFISFFGTLYMWMQCIITIHVASLHYDSNLTALRQCVASLSSFVLVVMAIFGTVETFLPKGPTARSALYICLFITTLCAYVLAANFCVFILSFEKDCKYFTNELHSELLFDEGYSFNEPAVQESCNVYGTQGLQSSAIVINGKINPLKAS